MMFTEGLDDNALHWVKQGSRGDKLDSSTHPFPEELPPSCVPDLFPKSHAAPSSSACLANFSHVLPPLKFHNGILASRLVVPSDDFDQGEDVGDDDRESVASAPSCCANGVADVGEGDGPEMPGDYDCYNVNDMFGDMPLVGAKRVAARLNRGVLLENLRVDVPRVTRSFMSDGETGIRSWEASGLNPRPATTNGNNLRENILLRNVSLFWG